MAKTKTKTPEELSIIRQNYNSRKKKWRDEHPKEWKAIVLRSFRKKIDEVEKAYAADLGNIHAELKE